LLAAAAQGEGGGVVLAHDLRPHPLEAAAALAELCAARAGPSAAERCAEAEEGCEMEMRCGRCAAWYSLRGVSQAGSQR
jgi:hypothetical protein